MSSSSSAGWRVGCSGFSYKEWKGIFYPADLPQKQWFSFYCCQFNCIEINASFYKTPSLASLQNWYQQSPTDFLFSFKIPRQITHYQQFTDTKPQVEAFYELLREGIQEKLGAILFQCPPSFSYTPERLDALLNQVDEQFPNVIEFRHKSWWQPTIWQTLAQKNITFCGVDFPGDIPQTAIVNTDTAYYRFHGRPVLFKSLYDEQTISTVFNDLKSPNLKRRFVFFNNTWGQSALINAQMMQEKTVS